MFATGKGLFGGNPMARLPQQPMTKPREGPSRTQGILGVLGDMLATAGGGQANYMPQIMQQRQIEQLQGYRTQQNKMEQDSAQQQWLARQAYERANPEPLQPTEFDRTVMGAGVDPASEQGRAMYRDRAAAMARDPADQFVTVTIPGVGTYAGPQSGLSSFAGSQQNRPAIGSTIRLGGGSPQMGAGSGPPTPTTTPEGLGAMISVHGVDQVQRWMQSGQLTLRGN